MIGLPRLTLGLVLLIASLEDRITSAISEIPGIRQSQLKLSIFKQDFLEVQIDSIFPNLVKDLRYGIQVDQSNRIFKINGRFVNGYLGSTDLMQNCTDILKLSETMFIMQCSLDEDSEMVYMQIFHLDQAKRELKLSSYISNDIKNLTFIDYDYEAVSSLFFIVGTPGIQKDDGEIEPNYEQVCVMVYDLSQLEGGELNYNSKITFKGYFDTSLVFLREANLQYRQGLLYIKNYAERDGGRPFFKVTIVSYNYYEQKLKVEGEYTSDPDDPYFKEPDFEQREYPLYRVQNFTVDDCTKYQELILMNDGGYVVCIDVDPEEGDSTVKAIPEEGDSTVKAIPFNLTIDEDPDVIILAFMQERATIITNQSDLSEKNIVSPVDTYFKRYDNRDENREYLYTLATDKIKKWIVNGDLTLRLSDSIDNFKIPHLRVVYSTIDPADNCLVILYQTKRGVVYSVVANFAKKKIRIFRDGWTGESYELFFSMEFGINMLIGLQPVQGRSNITIYKYQAETLTLDLGKLDFSQKDILYKRGILQAGTEQYLTYDIEIIKSLDIVIANDIFRDINIFKGQYDEMLQMPIEKLGLRANGEEVKLVGMIGQPDSRVSLKRLTSVAAKGTIFKDENFNVINPSASMFPNLIDTKTYLGFIMMLFKNNTAAVFNCEPYLITAEEICTRIQVENLIAIQNASLIGGFIATRISRFSYFISAIFFNSTTTSISVMTTRHSHSIELEQSVLSDFVIVDGEFRIVGDFWSFLGVGYFSDKPFVYSVVDFGSPFNQTELPTFIDPYLNHDLPFKEAKILRFERTDIDSFILEKELNSTTMIYYYGDMSIKNEASFSSMRVNNYYNRVIGITDTKIILYDLRKDMLLFRSFSSEYVQDSYLACAPITSPEDVTFFSGHGRLAVIIIKNYIHVYDLSSHDTDPLKRLIATEKIDERTDLSKKAIFKDQTFIWSSVNEEEAILTVFIASRLDPEKPEWTHQVFLFNMYGPSYLLDLQVNKGSKRISTLKFEVSSPALLSQDNKPKSLMLELNLDSGTKPNTKLMEIGNTPLAPAAPGSSMIYMKNYNSFVLAVPQDRKTEIVDKGKRPKFNIDDVLAYDCDIARFELRQPDEQIAEIKQAIDRFDPDEARLYPSNLMVNQDDVLFYGESLIQISNNHRVKFFLDKQTKESFSYGLNFTHTFVQILNLTTLESTERKFLIIFFTETNYPVMNMTLMVISLEQPYKFKLRTLPYVCEFTKDIKINLVAKNSMMTKISLFWIRRSGRGNEAVTSLLVLTPLEVGKGLENGFSSEFYSEIHSELISHRIIHFEVLSTQNTLAGFFFVENSAYITTLIMNLNKDNSVDKVDTGQSQFSNSTVLTEGSVIGCRPEPQELSLSCLVNFRSNQPEILSISLKFTFDTKEIVKINSEDVLKVPLNYKVERLFKLQSMNIVLFHFEDNLLPKRLCFYDLDSQRIFRELNQKDMPEGVSLSSLTYIVELTGNRTFLGLSNIPIRSAYLQRRDPEIIFKEGVNDLTNYYNYYLAIRGVRDKEKVVALYSMFELKDKTTMELIVIFVSAVSFFFVTATSLCIYKFCSSNDKLYTSPDGQNHQSQDDTIVNHDQGLNDSTVEIPDDDPDLTEARKGENTGQNAPGNGSGKEGENRSDEAGKDSRDIMSGILEDYSAGNIGWNQFDNYTMSKRLSQQSPENTSTQKHISESQPN